MRALTNATVFCFTSLDKVAPIPCDLCKCQADCRARLCQLQMQRRCNRYKWFFVLHDRREGEEKKRFISICNPFRRRKNHLSRVAKWLPVCVIERERQKKICRKTRSKSCATCVCVSPLHNLPCVATNCHVILQKTD